MFLVYKGYPFPISITSNVELDLSNCRLFSVTTKSSCVLTPMYVGGHDGVYEYQVVISAANTELLPIGSYALELRDTAGYMAKHIPIFCMVLDTAIVNLSTNN